MSPSRAALDESAASAAEVDPEAVRLALRDYVTLMATTERDRDDAQAQVSTPHAIQSRENFGL